MMEMASDDNQFAHLAGLLAALSSPHRLRILSILKRHGRQYVSELARTVGMSRPLLYLHLEKLETERLVKSHLSISAEGKALKWFEVCDFELVLSPEAIAAIADNQTNKEDQL